MTFEEVMAAMNDATDKAYQAFIVQQDNEIKRLRAEVTRLRAALEEARAALEDFGDHYHNCPALRALSTDPCDCGYQAAREALEGKR